MPPDSIHASGAPHRLIVTKDNDLMSEVVAELAPWERLQLMSIAVFSDGTKRGCCSRAGGLLGWVTVAAADGFNFVRRYARPIYEVTSSSLKVRKKLDLGSKFVAKLPLGCYLHVVAVEKVSDGSTRARVVVLDHHKLSAGTPLGWVTASKTDSGPAMLRKLRVPGDGAAEPFESSIIQVCSPAYSFVSPPVESQRAAFSNPVAPRAAHPSKSVSGDFAQFFGGAVRGVPTQADNAWDMVLGRLGELVQTSTSKDDKEAMHSRARMHSLSQRVQRPLLVGQTAAAVDVLASEEIQELQEDPGARETDVKASTQKKAKAKQPASALLASTDIVAAIDELKAAATAVQAQLDGSSFHTLPVQLGKLLRERSADEVTPGATIEKILRDWDPNRDGAVSRMEFRQGVRKLIEKADMKHIDALFAELDTDHSGELDIDETRVALKKLQKSATGATKGAEKVRARAPNWSYRRGEHSPHRPPRTSIPKPLSMRVAPPV